MKHSTEFIHLSIVIPIYNEEEVLPILWNRLSNVILELEDVFGESFVSETIFVDDGSKDKSLSIILELARNNKNIRVVRLTKNQGHMSALTAGISFSKGEYIVTMDADLQDPPEEIVPMVRKIKLNLNDVVQAERIDRSKDSITKRTSAKLFYLIMDGLLPGIAVRNAGDFRVMNRESAFTILNLKERNKIFRFLIPLLGFSIEYHGYKRNQREAGSSKYPFRKMARLAIESTLSFSSKPIRLLGIALLSSSVLSFILSVTFLYQKFFFFCYASLTFGMITISLAVLFEYVGKIYENILGRPEYRAIEIEVMNG